MARLLARRSHRPEAPEEAVTNVYRDVAVLATGHSFLEGPRWFNGRLFVSDFYTQRVLAFDSRGAMEAICHVPGRPSGLGFTPEGTMLVVSMTDRRLLRWNGRSLEEVVDLRASAAFHTNDMHVDSSGRAYIGNFGFDPGAEQEIKPTNLLLVYPDGQVAVAAAELVFPNGIVKTSDGATLLVAETFAARITAFDCREDGTLAGRRVWADLSTGRYGTIGDAVRSQDPLPDGIALDESGALWIGDANGAGPLLLAEGGEVLARVDTRDLAVYAVALGGHDRRTLFMCAAPPLSNASKPELERRACLLSCQVDVPAAT